MARFHQLVIFISDYMYDLISFPWACAILLRQIYVSDRAIRNNSLLSCAHTTIMHNNIQPSTQLKREMHTNVCVHTSFAYITISIAYFIILPYSFECDRLIVLIWVCAPHEPSLIEPRKFSEVLDCLFQINADWESQYS